MYLFINFYFFPHLKLNNLHDVLSAKITINESPVSTVQIHGILGPFSNNFVVKLHGAHSKYGSVLGCTCDPNTNVHHDNEHTYTNNETAGICLCVLSRCLRRFLGLG